MKMVWMRRFSGIVGVMLTVSAGAAYAELQRSVILYYDFETVNATNLFVPDSKYGGVVTNMTMAEIGASNHWVTSGSYASCFGMGQASNGIMRLWDSTTNDYATYMASEFSSKGSAVVAALNALTPGVYYLRVSYDMNRVMHNLKIGMRIYGNNGGVNQGARGTAGTSGWFNGLDSSYGGVPNKDDVRDNAFVKCVAEHEVNSVAGATGMKYPWRIKIIPATGAPSTIDEFREGSFKQLDISIWQTSIKEEGGSGNDADCYFDNFLIESFKVDPYTPFYLDETLRTTSFIPVNANFTTAFIDYSAGTTAGDGIVELVGCISTNTASITNYTRSGSVINFAPYTHMSGTTYYQGNLGSGILGITYAGPYGFNRNAPLWIQGDGQTEPTNRIPYWEMRELGVASHGFGGHANQFITFDTAKLRSYLLNGTLLPMVITGRFGMAGEVENANYTIRGGIWVDGVQKFISGSKVRANASDSFKIKLDPADRYITFAIMDNATYDYGQDCGIFKNVLVTLLPIGTVISLE